LNAEAGAGRRQAASPATFCDERGWQPGINDVLKNQIDQGISAVSDLTLSQAIENIYASIHANNEDIDLHITALKEAMVREGAKEAVFEPAKLAQSNRQGRKIMQSYFKKKGVTVSFSS
jgi:hypothetical protein